MADISLSSGSIVRPFRSPWGAFPTRSFGVSTGVSSAAIPAGRVVTTDYTEAGFTTNASFVKGSTATAAFYIAGVSAESVPSTTVAGTKISVWEANPLVEFRANTKNAPINSSNVGQTKALVYDSTLGIQFVDMVDSTLTNHRVVITQLIDAPGDTGGAVAFRFLSGLAGNIQGSSGTYNSTTPILAFYR